MSKQRKLVLRGYPRYFLRSWS